MAALRPSILLTTIRRTSLFATGPRASAVHRLIHTQEEVGKWVKEVVESEPLNSEEFKARVKEAVKKLVAERLAEEAKKKKTAVPRLIHTGVPPSWFEIRPTQEEVGKWVKEVTESEQFKSEEFKAKVKEDVKKFVAERLAVPAEEAKTVGNKE